MDVSKPRRHIPRREVGLRRVPLMTAPASVRQGAWQAFSCYFDWRRWMHEKTGKTWREGADKRKAGIGVTPRRWSYEIVSAERSGVTSVEFEKCGP